MRRTDGVARENVANMSFVEIATRNQEATEVHMSLANLKHHLKQRRTAVDNDELFELVRRKYAEANKEYIQEQIRVASECLTDEQKEELRQKRILT